MNYVFYWIPASAGMTIWTDSYLFGNSPTTGIAGSLNEAPQWGACGLLPMVNITGNSTLVALPPFPVVPVHECTPTPVPPLTQSYSRSTPSTKNSTP